MKYIKTYEKMGIDNLVIEISELIYEEFLKVYDKSKAFKNEKDIINIDISDIVKKHKLGEKFIVTFDNKISINYNDALSTTSSIGIINRENNKKTKTLKEIKSDIYHEVQHWLNLNRKYGHMQKIKNKFKRKNRIKFIHGVSRDFLKPLFDAFGDNNGNIYGKKISIQNFLTYNRYSEVFKKLVSYLYLAEENELSSRLHEIYIRTKDNKSIDTIKEYSAYNSYKNMINFKININDFSNRELKYMKDMFDLKNYKKVEKYINMKGEQFVKKSHKLLSY